ncbi:MAG: nickel pincer cofactor biosynthesis protein LarC [Candidatus Korobacteraceae bacterium]
MRTCPLRVLATPMRIAYLDCFSGISGDMFLGALLDAGVPFDLLQRTVADLNIDTLLEMARVDRNGISAVKLDVIVDGEKDLPREEFWKTGAGGRGLGAHEEQPGQLRHSHESASDEKRTAGPSTPLRSGRDDTATELATAQAGSVGRQYSHDGAAHSHAPSRSLNDILKIISAASISERAKQTASEIFLALGAAEAKVHNTGIEDIHFHEVGAADAIVDIVCAAVGADALGVKQFLCSPLNVGGGNVACAHGVMPVPAPATLELLRGVPIYSGDIQKELVTPTGAAIVKVIVSSFGSRPVMATEKIGYGAGSREFAGHANVLRLSIGETQDAEQADSRSDNAAHGRLAEEEIAILEANLDDLNPQLIGYIVERALDEGALDVFTAAVQMKKNRPGTLLTVLARPEDEGRLRALVFRESSTLGVRTRHEKRYALARRHEAVTTPWGEVRMKVASLNGTVSQYAPEYEDCRRIAAEHHLPLKTVMQEAIRLYLDRQNG